MKTFLLFLISIFNIMIYAGNIQPQIIPKYDPQIYDQQINKIYQTVLNDKNDNTVTRVTKASRNFLGKPYVLFPLGEGPDAEFDKNPLYRTDAFDCETYVDTVLALAHANNLSEFKYTINKIRYNKAQVSYLQRNHFTSVDWNPNLRQQDYIKDITAELPAPYKVATAVIDKPNWYRKKQASDIKLFAPVSAQQSAELLTKLRANSQKTQPIVSRIKYIPLAELFSRQGGQIVPNQKVFDAIPSGAIIEIVRPNWDVTSKIGTRLNVEHMGFAIRTPQGLMFREASSHKKQVMDFPLGRYLTSFYLHNQPIGIHVEEVLNSR